MTAPPLVPPLNPWLGRCFEASLRLLCALHPSIRDRWVLVHGVCYCPEAPYRGQAMAHAWLQQAHLAPNSVVVDPVAQRAWLWYRYKGLLRAARVQTFSYRQACEQIYDQQSFGPWPPQLQDTRLLMPFACRQQAG